MKKILIPILLTVLILSACATATPQATPTPVRATETFIPATATAVETETTVPTSEAVLPTHTAIVENTSASVSFANQVFPILNTYCVECHGGQRTREGLNLTTYDGLIAGSDNGAVIIAGNGNESLFIDLIVQGEMPSRGAAPSSEEIQILIDWVNQGALNN
jgi:cytochrome c5